MDAMVANRKSTPLAIKMAIAQYNRADTAVEQSQLKQISMDDATRIFRKMPKPGLHKWLQDPHES